MNRHLRRLLRLLDRLAEATPEPVTVECRCPTWGEWADILAAASLTAGNTPNGMTVGRVLAVLSAVAARIGRDQVHRDADD